MSAPPAPAPSGAPGADAASGAGVGASAQSGGQLGSFYSQGTAARAAAAASGQSAAAASNSAAASASSVQSSDANVTAQLSEMRSMMEVFGRQMSALMSPTSQRAPSGPFGSMFEPFGADPAAAASTRSFASAHADVKHAGDLVAAGDRSAPSTPMPRGVDAVAAHLAVSFANAKAADRSELQPETLDRFLSNRSDHFSDPVTAAGRAALERCRPTADSNPKAKAEMYSRRDQIGATMDEWRVLHRMMERIRQRDIDGLAAIVVARGVAVGQYFKTSNREFLNTLAPSSGEYGLTPDEEAAIYKRLSAEKKVSLSVDAAKPSYKPQTSKSAPFNKSRGGKGAKDKNADKDN